VRASEPVIERDPFGIVKAFVACALEGAWSVASHSATAVFMARLYCSIFVIESCTSLKSRQCHTFHHAVVTSYFLAPGINSRASGRQFMPGLDVPVQEEGLV
jgi:hypothetical protein